MWIAGFFGILLLGLGLFGGPMQQRLSTRRLPLVIVGLILVLAYAVPRMVAAGVEGYRVGREIRGQQGRE